jgi:hypothetical protein
MNQQFLCGDKYQCYTKVQTALELAGECRCFASSINLAVLKSVFTQPLKAQVLYFVNFQHIFSQLVMHPFSIESGTCMWYPNLP